MSNNSYPKISKTKLDLTIDLFHSLRIVKDSLEMLKKGHYYQLGIIYTQLRSLLTDRSSKGVEPLLPLISNYLESNLDLYYIKAVPIIKSAHFEYLNQELSLEKKSQKHTKIDIIKYLNETAIIVEGHEIKVKELIGHLANSYGGAHYSSKIPEYLLKLKPFKFGRHNVFDTYAIQLAELCLQLGIKLLKKITDFSLYFYIYLPENKPKTEQYLIDIKSTNSANQISIVFNQGDFHFLVIDSIGKRFIAHTNEIIPQNDFYLINLTHCINKNLCSEFEIHLNEKNYIKEIDNNPLLFLNEIINFDVQINRSVNKKNDDFKFGLLDYKFFNMELTYIDKINFFSEFINSEKEEMEWFSNNNSATSQAGKKEWLIDGNIKSVAVKDYVKESKK